MNDSTVSLAAIYLGQASDALADPQMRSVALALAHLRGMLCERVASLRAQLDELDDDDPADESACAALDAAVGALNAVVDDIDELPLVPYGSAVRS